MGFSQPVERIANTSWQRLDLPKAGGSFVGG
jgi:hypothetical protein